MTNFNDLILPKILTLGGLLSIGNLPEMKKTDFPFRLLAHMAGGLSFKDMTPLRPLKIFYLQKIFGHHFLYQKIQKMNFDKDTLGHIYQNLFIVPHEQARWIFLYDEGVKIVGNIILNHFDPLELNIIAIDPFEGFYDGNNENAHKALIPFLKKRVKRLRDMINPSIGIIITNHLKQMPKNFPGLEGYTNVNWLNYPLN